MTNVEQQLAALNERVAFLESVSPQYDTAKRERDRKQLAARMREVKTVEQWKALDNRERNAFRERATFETLSAMLRDASSEDRNAVLAGVAWHTNASVRFLVLAPAPAPHVEVTAFKSFTTRAVGLTEEQAEQLGALGLKVRGRKDPTEARWMLSGFAGNVGEVQTFTAEAWEARLAVDGGLARAVRDGLLSVRTLDESEARQFALDEFVRAVHRAADEANSNMAPELPAV
jgi:hypothetical protein